MKSPECFAHKRKRKESRVERARGLLSPFPRPSCFHLSESSSGGTSIPGISLYSVVQSLLVVLLSRWRWEEREKGKHREGRGRWLKAVCGGLPALPWPSPRLSRSSLRESERGRERWGVKKQASSGKQQGTFNVILSSLAPPSLS